MKRITTFFVIIVLVLMIIALFYYMNLFNGADHREENLERISLRLLWEYQSQFIGYLIAKEKGFYREEGLDVVIREGHAEGNLASLVAAGVDDFGVMKLQDLIMSVDNGRDVKAIAQIFQHNNQLILAMKKSGIDSLHAFKNKTYSSWSGASDLMLRLLLLQNNVENPKIKILPFKYWTIDNFITGKAQLIKVMKYNEYHRVLQRGVLPWDLKVFALKDFGLDIPEDTIYTSNLLIKKRPELCKKFIKASIRGWRYALQHPNEHFPILKKYMKNIDKEHENFMFKIVSESILDSATNLQHIGEFDTNKIGEFLELLYKNNQLKHRLLPKDVVDTSIIFKIMN